MGVTRSNEAGSLEEMGLPPPKDFGGESNQPRRDEARMRTNSRRRGPGLGLAVLALVVSLPELARAQQGGLFPLAPIRRQRVPCDQQDPIYKTYKYQYLRLSSHMLAPVPGWVGLSESRGARQSKIVPGAKTGGHGGGASGTARGGNACATRRHQARGAGPAARRSLPVRGCSMPASRPMHRQRLEVGKHPRCRRETLFDSTISRTTRRQPRPIPRERADAAGDIAGRRQWP